MLSFSITLLGLPYEWFTQQSPRSRSPSTENIEEYNYGMFQGLRGVTLESPEDGTQVYHYLPFPLLIQRYLIEQKATRRVVVHAIQRTQNYSPTPIDYHITRDHYRRVFFSHWLAQPQVALFFRDSCCVVCEMDVLNEGGRHTNICPVGLLLGPTQKDAQVFLTPRQT